MTDNHGHWYFLEPEYFICSECGESYYNGCETTNEANKMLEENKAYPNCPFCRAIMDFKEE